MDTAQLKQAGFSDQEVSQYDTLQKAGFTDTEIIDHLSKGTTAGTITKPPVALPWTQRAQHFFSLPGPGEEGIGTQLIRGTTPALGMVGATIGSTFGPSGTALGYAGGARVGKAIETLAGVTPPLTPTKAAIGTAEDIGVGYLPWGIGKAAGVVSKVPGAVKGALTRPWTTGGKVKEVFKQVGGKLEPSLAGESAVTGAKQTLTAVSKQGNRLYETAKSLTPEGSTAELNNLYSTVDTILKDETLTPVEKKLANTILERISPEVRSGTRRFGLSPELQAEIKGDLGITTRPSTLEEAYAIRSQLSKETAKGGKIGWKAGEMLDALHQDLGETADKLGIPEVTKAYKNAIGFWRDKVIPQRETVKLLEKKSFEKVSDLLKTDIRTTQRLKSAMPKEQFQDLKRGLVTDISNKVENNPIKTAKELRSLMAKRKEVMQNIFNPEELDAIRLSADPSKLGRYLEDHPRVRWLVKWLPVGMAIEIGRDIFGGKLPFTVHHGMEH